MHGERGLEVLDNVGVQGTQDAQLVGDAGQVRKEITEHQSRLPACLELERRAEQKAAAKFLAMIGRELRLGIERIDLRIAAGEKDDDHTLGPGRKMRAPRGERPAAIHLGRPRPPRGGAGAEATAPAEALARKARRVMMLLDIIRFVPRRSIRRLRRFHR